MHGLDEEDAGQRVERGESQQRGITAGPGDSDTGGGPEGAERGEQRADEQLHRPPRDRGDQSGSGRLDRAADVTEYDHGD